MAVSEMSIKIERALAGLVGFQVLKVWNVFATSFFYFGPPGSTNYDGEVWLELECPWRIDREGRMVVGSEDYGERAEGNTDLNWSAKDDQTGHLQQQKLEALLGGAMNGAVLNTTAQFVVEKVRADSVGGFQLYLSGAHILSVFPAGTTGMQWLLSRRELGQVALMDSCLSGTLLESQS
jgi:hypothetical protein